MADGGSDPQGPPPYDISAEGLGIESAANAGVREGRRRARVGRDMTTYSTDVYLRDR